METVETIEISSSSSSGGSQDLPCRAMGSSSVISISDDPSSSECQSGFFERTESCPESFDDYGSSEMSSIDDEFSSEDETCASSEDETCASSEDETCQEADEETNRSSCEQGTIDKSIPQAVEHELQKPNSQLSSLSVAALKCYLKASCLRLSGSKAELIDRVQVKSD
jgi:hypothetical protein